jgi:hypothetical protein
MSPRFFFTPALLALVLFASSAAQTTSPPKFDASAPASDEKSEAVLKRAVESLGGANFLAVRTVVGRGNYTPFVKGVSDLPVTFLDYIAFPDRERTEFKGRGARTIQANVGTGEKAAGWVFDGALKSAPIRDMKADQIEDFRITMRTSLDNVLRGWWRAEGAKLSYAGRREAGLARRNEAVRLIYPDGFAVEYEFGAKDGLPAKTIYKRMIKVGEEEKEATEEDRYLRFLPFGGVNAPVIVDHYRDGVQTSRVLYDSVEYNRPVPDELFVKPADAKAAMKTMK